MSISIPQASSSLLMVKPKKFGYNLFTAATNSFQKENINIDPLQIHNIALKEFEDFVEALKKNRIDVVIFEDLHDKSPDSIFPNNWISFHEDGTVVLYPMFAPNRRLERRSDILVSLQKVHNFDVKQILDFTHHEKDLKYLEGTGSIVFDYVNKIAYSNISVRTDLQVLDKLMKTLNYSLVHFKAVDKGMLDIYHTNVLMCIAEKYAVVCAESIPDSEERKIVIRSLKETDHEIVYITYEQLNSFAGNMLEVLNQDGESNLLMSQTAYKSLSSHQLNQIHKYSKILPMKVDVIETFGGGSVRCMVAGIHLPKMAAMIKS
jgi:hypothetical protein